MDNTISKNPESVPRKNPLRARFENMAPKTRKEFKADYEAKFELKGRSFGHRMEGRTKISKEEVKWLNAWKSKK